MTRAVVAAKGGEVFAAHSLLGRHGQTTAPFFAGSTVLTARDHQWFTLAGRDNLGRIAQVGAIAKSRAFATQAREIANDLAHGPNGDDAHAAP